MHGPGTPTDRRSPSARGARVARRSLLRFSLAALLGVAAALLIACSGSGKGLIPTGDAGPLQSDFEAVAHAAENGNGHCSETEAALQKTDQDFAALPSSVDTGLHNTLRQGIENLRTRALALCTQPLPGATETTSTEKSTTSTTDTTSTPTETQSTPTQTTPTTPEPTEPSGPGGGTPAPGEGNLGGAEESEAGTGGASGGAKVQGPQEGAK
ncbi:MAG TPA: hypothetical protein VHT25_11470 [Solirubrobacteraceae bacterium]|jgi:hypothetical protein|nr:hypothetical protein [Solirubrobacteraceae bacterium]